MSNPIAIQHSPNGLPGACLIACGNFSAGGSLSRPTNNRCGALLNRLTPILAPLAMAISRSPGAPAPGQCIDREASFPVRAIFNHRSGGAIRNQTPHFF